MVDRDNLADGGSAHVTETIQAIMRAPWAVLREITSPVPRISLCLHCVFKKTQ